MHDPNHEPLTPGSIAAILPAAGSGHRFGAVHNKLFAMLAGKPLWLHSVKRLASRPEIGRITLAIAEADRELFLEQSKDLPWRHQLAFVCGGAQRSDSVAAALVTLDNENDVRYVAVHDAARPLVKTADLAAVFAMANQTGAAILATPITGTVKRCPVPFYVDETIGRPLTPTLSPTKRGGEAALWSCTTVDRRELWTALTPQVFRIDLLRSAYARHRGFPVTDDAQLVERMGHPVAIVKGAADNLKITYPEDLAIAEAILKQHAS